MMYDKRVRLPRNSVKSYFETHANEYQGANQEWYSSMISKLKMYIPTADHIRFLDIGCGNGNFIKELSAGLEAEYFGTDLSLRMIRIAKDNLVGCKVGWVVADGFKMPFTPNLKFHVIHLDAVLHHLTAKTKAESLILVKQFIEILVERLTENGILIVEEVNFTSALVPTFTSFLVFYGLKLINFLKVDLSRYARPGMGPRPGLEVNFFNEKQLGKILSAYGSLHLVDNTPYKIPNAYKVFLLKKFGHLMYVLKNE